MIVVMVETVVGTLLVVTVLAGHLMVVLIQMQLVIFPNVPLLPFLIDQIAGAPCKCKAYRQCSKKHITGVSIEGPSEIDLWHGGCDLGESEPAVK